MLQPEQFPKKLYHGTTFEFKPGDKLLPSEMTGNSNHGNFNAEVGQDAAKHVHATADEDTAWSFASLASGRQTDWDNNPRGRTRVYTVEPNSETRRGYETWHSEHVAPHFIVTGEEHTRVPPPGGHRQGTLPLNWRQFKSKYAQPVGDEINHPTNYSVERETSGPLVNWHASQHDDKHDVPYDDTWRAKQNAKKFPQQELFSAPKNPKPAA